MTEQHGYWQDDDKAALGKVILAIGLIAAAMALVAVVIGFIL